MTEETIDTLDDLLSQVADPIVMGSRLNAACHKVVAMFKALEDTAATERARADVEKVRATLVGEVEETLETLENGPAPNASLAGRIEQLVGNLTARAEEAEARAALATHKQSAMADRLTVAERELAEATAKLRIVETGAADVWFWEGRGDEVGSLSCPVVMSAETCRDLLHGKDRLDTALGDIDALIEKVRAAEERAAGLQRLVDQAESVIAEDAEASHEDERPELARCVELVIRQRDDERQRAAELQARVDAIAGPLQDGRRMAGEAYRMWDRDEDHRVGKRIGDAARALDVAVAALRAERVTAAHSNVIGDGLYVGDDSAPAAHGPIEPVAEGVSVRVASGKLPEPEWESAPAAPALLHLLTAEEAGRIAYERETSTWGRVRWDELSDGTREEWGRIGDAVSHETIARVVARMRAVPVSDLGDEFTLAYFGSGTRAAALEAVRERLIAALTAGAAPAAAKPECVPLHRRTSTEAETPATVVRGHGHSGFGWYVWATEYPEDGSIYLGKARRPSADDLAKFGMVEEDGKGKEPAGG